MKATILLLLAGLSIAQAAEPKGTLTLACQGAVSNSLAPDSKPEPISMGVIVNFAARRVEFGHEVNFPVGITDITETTISFFGHLPNDPVFFSITDGVIDRMTGAVEAEIFRRERGGTTCDAAGKRKCKSWMASYSLKCKPTQRMF
jgi:hypothetical protein